MMALGATVEEIEDFAILECVTFDLYPPDVCEGMVRLAGVSLVLRIFFRSCVFVYLTKVNSSHTDKIVEFIAFQFTK